MRVTRRQRAIRTTASRVTNGWVNSPSGNSARSRSTKAAAPAVTQLRDVGLGCDLIEHDFPWKSFAAKENARSVPARSPNTDGTDFQTSSSDCQRRRRRPVCRSRARCASCQSSTPACATFHQTASAPPGRSTRVTSAGGAIEVDPMPRLRECHQVERVVGEWQRVRVGQAPPARQVPGRAAWPACGAMVDRDDTRTATHERPSGDASAGADVGDAGRAASESPASCSQRFEHLIGIARAAGVVLGRHDVEA